jgi:hypothetical protein
MNHDDTYEKDVLSQHWVCDIPKSVVSYRVSVRGGERGGGRRGRERAEMYGRWMKNDPTTLLRLSSAGFAQTDRVPISVRASLWDAFGRYLRGPFFGGEKNYVQY